MLNPNNVLQVYSPIEFQNVLANQIIKNNTFKFNTRPVPNIKKGTMYCFKAFNDHAYNGVFVESFSFFKKDFNSSIQLDKRTQVGLRGYGNIKNKNLVAVLREKIRAALMEVTSKDHFTENCDVVLRFSGIATCSGMESARNKHTVCISAKAVFEKLKNVEIVPNKNGESVSCLFKNIVHSHKEFEKLKITYCDQEENFTITNGPIKYNPESGQYSLVKRENRKFIHNVMPSDCIDENIYSSHTKSLSGLLSVGLTGVYLNDETLRHDTMTVWCKIENAHLVTDTYEVSQNVAYGFGIEGNEDYEDDILREEKEEKTN